MTAARRRAVAGVIAVTAVMAGCSSTSTPVPRATPLGPAAEPSTALSVSAPPVGRLVRLPASSSPEGVAVDPRTHTVVVALHKPDRVAVVDERTLTVRIRAVPGSGRHLALAEPGGPVLLPAEDTDQLLQLSPISGRVLRTTTLPRQPHNATIVGSHIWVDDELAGELSVLDLDGRIVATVRGPVQPGGVATAAGVVGAVDVRGARMYFYDATTYRAEGSIPLGAGPTHTASVGGDDVVVADTRGGALLLIDLVTRTIVSRLSLPGGSYGLATDPSTGEIWTTLTQLKPLCTSRRPVAGCVTSAAIPQSSRRTPSRWTRCRDACMSPVSPDHCSRSSARTDPKSAAATNNLAMDVILPCLDEVGALPWVLSRMPAGFRPIVADNGSTDGSARVASEYGATVVSVPQRGFGAACHAGLEAATSEVVCFMDADASLDPRQLPLVAQPVTPGEADLVLGRRRPTSFSAWPPHARLANAVLAHELRRRAGIALRDLGPMRAVRRRALLDLGLADRRFGYPLQMVTLGAAAGWRIREVDVDYLPRKGRSKVTGTVRGTARAVRDMRAVLADVRA